MPTNSSNSSSQPTWSLPGEEWLDLRGEVCPFTFVRTKLCLEVMEVGATLGVLLDFEAATRNVPRSAREWGQEVCDVVELDAGLWRVRLKKLH